MDWVMASIVDQLKESGLLDKTLVVITNDHGEMLGANGGSIGHGWAITPELANTPLIIMDPQNPGCHLNYTLGSQIDVLPTLLDLLKISFLPGQLYEGRSLYAPPAGDDRLVYLNSYEQYGVIAGNHFVSGDRKADEGGAIRFPKNRLCDLQPGEQDSLHRGSAGQGTARVDSPIRRIPGKPAPQLFLLLRVGLQDQTDGFPSFRAIARPSRFRLLRGGYPFGLRTSPFASDFGFRIPLPCPHIRTANSRFETLLRHSPSVGSNPTARRVKNGPLRQVFKC